VSRLALHTQIVQLLFERQVQVPRRQALHVQRGHDVYVRAAMVRLGSGLGSGLAQPHSLFNPRRHRARSLAPPVVAATATTHTFPAREG